MKASDFSFKMATFKMANFKMPKFAVPKFTVPGKMLTSFYKTPFITKLFYLLTALILANLILSAFGIKHKMYKKEGFAPLSHPPDQDKNFSTKYGTDIYDEFYVDIYDDLVFSKMKDDFEISEFIKSTNPTSASYILDIGSGTGHHVKQLSEYGFKTIGIDNSSAMVTKAKKTYPEITFIQGDVLETLAFQPNTFTHMTCLYFTLYYIKNKRQFFDNCMRWLQPGGFLAIHLVNRDTFDPVIPASSPFSLVSPQHYAKKRITTSKIIFDQFEYKSNFQHNFKENDSGLHEIFKFNDGKIRKNEHKFYMEPQAEILTMAKNAGFILHTEIDMLKCQYEDQFIYILQKPF